VDNRGTFCGCGPKGDYQGQSEKEDVRGKDTVPVISLEGAIGVLL